MGFFCNRTVLRAVSVRPTTYRVSDSLVVFTPVPTPHSRSSLSHPHKFMGFFPNNRTVLRGGSPNLTTYSVSDNTVTFTLEPTPRSSCSIFPTHIIHTPTLPMSTTTILFSSRFTSYNKQISHFVSFPLSNSRFLRFNKQHYPSLQTKKWVLCRSEKGVSGGGEH